MSEMRAFVLLISFTYLFATSYQNSLDPTFDFIYDNVDITIGEDSVGSFSGTLYNISSNNIIISVVRTVDALPQGWSSSICLGAICYNESVDSVAVELSPGDTTVCGILTWSNGIGSGSIQIKIFDLYLPDNSIIVDLTFSANTIHIVGEKTLIPEKYQLHQNYPNPFNPSTLIEYELKSDEVVYLTIYDYMGRNIKNLVNRYQGAGYWSINWDATNNYGEPMASGAYIYTLQAGDFQSSRKLVLLK